MSKKEFMEELEVLLGELPKEEREEALQYYESYFEEAGADQEQVVLEEFGSAGRIAAQILRDYRAERPAGIYVKSKGINDGTPVIVILVAILTFPVWISLLVAMFGLLVGFGVGGGACVIAGIAVFAVGIVNLFTIPVVGAVFIAAALLVFGVGCILIAATGGIVRLGTWIVSSVTKWLSHLFHGRKGTTV